MSVHTTFGFVLPCCVCGERRHVGPTARKHGCEFVFYFEPGCEFPDASRIVGVADKGPDSFRCYDCLPAEKEGA